MICTGRFWAFTSDPDRLARFEREAKVLALLNHPNIAAIHGLEESDGILYRSDHALEGPPSSVRLSGRNRRSPLHQVTAPMSFRSGVDGVPAGTSRRSWSAVAG